MGEKHFADNYPSAVALQQGKKIRIAPAVPITAFDPHGPSHTRNINPPNPSLKVGSRSAAVDERKKLVDRAVHRSAVDGAAHSRCFIESRSHHVAVADTRTVDIAFRKLSNILPIGEACSVFRSWPDSIGDRLHSKAPIGSQIVSVLKLSIGARPCVSRARPIAGNPRNYC